MRHFLTIAAFSGKQDTTTMAENAKEGEKEGRKEGRKKGTKMGRRDMTSSSFLSYLDQMFVRPLICRLPLLGFLPEHGVPVKFALNCLRRSGSGFMTVVIDYES